MSESGTPLLNGLVDDLTAESADLDARVARLDDDAWLTPTPAAGWDIRDTINHLRFFDRDALLAVTDPDGFTALVAALGAEAGQYVERLTVEGRATPPAEVLAAWRTGREALAAALRGIDPGVRVPWFGPPMSPASFITARLMETWAHGQDVVDALGQDRPATGRLRSVAEIGVRARPFSTPSAACRCRSARSGSNSPDPTGSRGPGARRTPPTSSAARRWTSACWSPSAGTGTTWTSR